VEVPDQDGDGLTVWTEECLSASDPEVDDTDGGGTPDGAELFALTDPIDPADDGPLADSDGDGVTDFVEVTVLGTDPFVP
jgi:large repetitive protein